MDGFSKDKVDENKNMLRLDKRIINKMPIRKYAVLFLPCLADDSCLVSVLTVDFCKVFKYVKIAP